MSSRFRQLERRLLRAEALRRADAPAAPTGPDPEADAARADPNVWAELYSGQAQAGYHRTLQQAFSDNRYLIVEGPPEVGKSQQLTLRRVLWEIGNNPNITIGIVGAKAEQAFEWIRAIRDGVESEVFRRVFPGVVPGDPWTTERLYVQRSNPTLTAPTVQGIGIGGTFLGARLNLIILDDILNALNTATKQQRKKTLDWVDSSMCAGRLLAGGKLVLIGNTWTSDDAIHELSKRTTSDGASVYRYQRDPLPDPDAPDAVSPLPEIWPLDRIRERRDFIGPSRFRWQYQLQPRGAEDSRFDPAWFETPSTFRCLPPRPTVPFVAPPGSRLAIGVDLGIGLEDRHDRTAFVVVMRDEHKVRHVLHVETTRATGPGIIDRMAVLEQSYRHTDGSGPTFRVESVAAQEFLAQFARQQLSSPIASHSTTGSGTSITNKTWGIEQLAVRAESGQLKFCVEPGGRWPAASAALRDAMLWYTPREHTADEVMALLFAETQLMAGDGVAVGAGAFGKRPAKPTEGSALLKFGA